MSTFVLGKGFVGNGYKNETKRYGDDFLGIMPVNSIPHIDDTVGYGVLFVRYRTVLYLVLISRVTRHRLPVCPNTARTCGGTYVPKRCKSRSKIATLYHTTLAYNLIAAFAVVVTM